MENVSPCRSCVRCSEPYNCGNKNCEDWRKWFLAQWARIHAFGKKHLPIDREEPDG